MDFYYQTLVGFGDNLENYTKHTFNIEYEPTQEDLEKWAKEEDFKSVDTYAKAIIKDYYGEDYKEELKLYLSKEPKQKRWELEDYIGYDKDREKRFNDFIVNLKKKDFEKKIFEFFQCDLDIDTIEVD